MSCKKERSPTGKIVRFIGEALIWVGLNTFVYLMAGITSGDGPGHIPDGYSFSPLAHPVICLVLLSGNIVLLGFILMKKSDELTE